MFFAWHLCLMVMTSLFSCNNCVPEQSSWFLDFNVPSTALGPVFMPCSAPEQKTYFFSCHRSVPEQRVWFHAITAFPKRVCYWATIALPTCHFPCCIIAVLNTGSVFMQQSHPRNEVSSCHTEYCIHPISGKLLYVSQQKSLFLCCKGN